MSLEYHESASALKSNLRKTFEFNFRFFLLMIILHISLIFALCWVTKPYNIYVLVKYTECKIKALITPQNRLENWKINFRNFNGSCVQTGINNILKNELILCDIKDTKRWLIILAFLTSPIWLFRKEFLKVLIKTSRKKYGDKYIRGAKLIDYKQYNNQVKKDNKDTYIKLGNIKSTVEAENRHYLIIGKPGSGKSQCIFQMLENINNRGDKCIIHDPKGEYMQHFFDPTKDLIFNPLDARSINWNIFNDVKNIMDIEAISSSLIPEAENKDKFWNDGARTIFVAILKTLSEIGPSSCNNEGIWQMLKSDAEKLAEQFLNTPGAQAAYRFFHTGGRDNVSKHTDALLATLMQYTRCFEYLALTNKNLDDFSVSNWLLEGKGSIFISNHEDVKDTLKPILSLFVDLLGRKILSFKEDINRRLFLVLDEFGSLQKLPTIVSFLTKARSKGGCCILGTQDFGQIDNIYGKDISQSIINSCSNKIFFAVEDSTTAKRVSENIGSLECYETYKNINTSKKSTFSLNQKIITKPLFLPSEIQNLKDLSAVVKIHQYPYLISEWEYKKINQNCEPFIVNNFLNIGVR